MKVEILYVAVGRQMKKADLGVFRAFIRGKSLAQIAEEKGIDYASVWKQIRRTIARLQKHGGVPLDLKFQQYLLLSHAVDEALEAFRESQQSGVRSVLSTTSTGDDNVKSKKVATRVTKDAGDPRFLELALRAMKEIRDLWCIGAEAESKLKTAAGNGSSLEALLRTGSVRIATQWAGPIPGEGHSFKSR